MHDQILLPHSVLLLHILLLVLLLYITLKRILALEATGHCNGGKLEALRSHYPVHFICDFFPGDAMGAAPGKTHTPLHLINSQEQSNDLSNQVVSISLGL